MYIFEECPTLMTPSLSPIEMLKMSFIHSTILICSYSMDSFSFWLCQACKTATPIEASETEAGTRVTFF